MVPQFLPTMFYLFRIHLFYSYTAQLTINLVFGGNGFVYYVLKQIFLNLS